MPMSALLNHLSPFDVFRASRDILEASRDTDTHVSFVNILIQLDNPSSTMGKDI